jgi:hypothetical protein
VAEATHHKARPAGRAQGSAPRARWGRPLGRSTTRARRAGPRQRKLAGASGNLIALLKSFSPSLIKLVVKAYFMFRIGTRAGPYAPRLHLGRRRCRCSSADDDNFASSSGPPPRRCLRALQLARRSERLAVGGEMPISWMLYADEHRRHRRRRLRPCGWALGVVRWSRCARSAPARDALFVLQPEAAAAALVNQFGGATKSSLRSLGGAVVVGRRSSSPTVSRPFVRVVPSALCGLVVSLR